MVPQVPELDGSAGLLVPPEQGVASFGARLCAGWGPSGAMSDPEKGIDRANPVG